MLKLTPTKNADLIISFMKGDGIRRRCAGGKDVSVEAVRELISKSKGTFLVASEGNRGLGFIMLNPEMPGVYSIHICVRTIGEKTKRIFALGIQYARFVLNAEAVDAVFPESYRACKRLATAFGFKDNKSIISHYKLKEVPYLYQRLTLNT